MADVPYPVTGRDPAQAITQIRQLIDELFQERVAGTLIGDVFYAGSDDVFTINLKDDGGLDKESSKLKVKPHPTGGVDTTADGVKVKLDTNSVMGLSAGGLRVLNEKIWPVGAIFVSAVPTDPNTLMGFGTWVLLGSGDLTLT